MMIIKKDGRLQDFDENKIKTSIGNAAKSISQAQSTDFDTTLAMTESHIAQEEAIYKGAEKGTVEAIRNKYKSMNDKRIKDLENEKEYLLV